MIDLPKTRADAEALDAADPLAERRALFVPPPGVAYMGGHSLGPATQAAVEAVSDGARRGWAEGLVGAWNTEGWIGLADRAAAKLASLIGAAPSEVAVCDTVSVNLFKLAGAALPLCASRTVIVERDDFPTDLYVAQGLADLGGAERQAAEPGGGAEALGATGGVLIKSAVNYRTGLIADVEAHEAAARSAGGLIVWDLSHATGVVPLDLGARGATLAAGCTYKYLGGGPGAPSFVYAADGIADRLANPIAGWFGHEAPFAFDEAYRPKPGAARFQAGTPPILSLLALDAALGAFEGLDPATLHEKAGRLGDMMVARLGALGLEPQVPTDAARRGGHVSFAHDDGYALVRALIERGVHGDFREPGTVRFGLSPLPLSYAQVWDALDIAEGVLTDRAYDDARYRQRTAVT